MTCRQFAAVLSVAFLISVLASCGSSKSASSQSSLLPDGTYVFHLAGQAYSSSTQPSSPYFAVGAFTVSNGAITQGEEDFVDYYGTYTSAPIQAYESGLGTTLDGNLQIKLYTGYQAPFVIGVGGIQTINANMISATSGRIAEFDTSATGTGTLDLQSSTAQPSGGYAFFTAGLDNEELPLALGGVLSVGAGGGISATGSVFDLNDSPSLGLFPAQTLSTTTASAVSTPDQFGRVVFTLIPNTTTIGNIQLVGYVVNATTIPLVELRDGLLATTGGTALSQGANTGNFSTANLSGFTYVVGSQGQETASGGTYSVGTGYSQFAGALSFNSDNSVTGSASFNDLKTQLANGAIGTGASYTVDPTGRVTVTGLTTTDPRTPAALQLYLDGSGNAFVISMGTDDVTGGVGFQQTAGASVGGSYSITACGVTPVLDTTTHVTSDYFWAGVGEVSVGGGSASGFTDMSFLSNPALSGSQNADVGLGGTATGTGAILTGTIAGVGYQSTTINPGADEYVYYVIDNNRAFGIETDSNQLSQLFAQSSAQ